MAAEEQMIVAIEFGSSKITGVAGRRLTDGTWQIEAVSQEPAQQFMRNGVVYNHDKCVVAIKKVVKALSTRTNRYITQVYVGTGGQGLHTEKNTVVRRFEESRAVPLDVVNEMMQENLSTPVRNLEIVKAIPQEYRVGNQRHSDPVGVLTTSIEGEYLNLVARPSVRGDIRNCFSEAGVEVAELCATPLLLGKELLSDDERRSGCVLVDFGAHTTTVLVYKGGYLRYLSVLPIGSAHITKDITSLNGIEEREAEQLKITYGYTGESLSEEEKAAPAITLSDGQVVSKATLINIIEARLEEILVNVKEQIAQSDKPLSILLSGAVLVGEGAQLKNMVGAFKKFVHEVNRVSIRTGKPAVRFIRELSRQYGANTMGLVGALCVLANGTQNCVGDELPPQGSGDIFTSTTPKVEPAPKPEPAPAKEEEKQKDEDEEPKKHKSGFLRRVTNALTRATNKIVGEDEDIKEE